MRETKEKINTKKGDHKLLEFAIPFKAFRITRAYMRPMTKLFLLRLRKEKERMKKKPKAQKVVPLSLAGERDRRCWQIFFAKLLFLCAHRIKKTNEAYRCGDAKNERQARANLFDARFFSSVKYYSLPMMIVLKWKKPPKSPVQKKKQYYTTRTKLKEKK